MNNKIIISIIIPTYNRYYKTKKLIDKFLSLYEKEKEIEIIVVDDGSEDKTSNLVNEIKSSNFKYYKIKNSERGYARNYGLSKSLGNYINYFDSDDEPFDNHIKVALDTIQKYNHNIFHTSYLIQNKNKNKLYVDSGYLNSKVKKKNILSLNNVFIKREIALNNKFCEDRNLSGTEDWLLWLKISKKYQIIGISTITSKIIDNNLRSTKIENYKPLFKRVNYLEVFLENDDYFNGDLTENEKKMILSEMYSILCLYLSFFEKRTVVIKFFFKSFLLHYNTLFRLRNVIILKNIFKLL